MSPSAEYADRTEAALGGALYGRGGGVDPSEHLRMIGAVAAGSARVGGRKEPSEGRNTSERGHEGACERWWWRWGKGCVRVCARVCVGAGGSGVPLEGA